MMNKNINHYSDKREEPFINIPQQKLVLYLLLFGLSILFIVFAIAYVSTRSAHGNQGVYLPPVFILNSFLLLASSFSVNRANKAYRLDNTRNYQIMLWVTLFLTLVFLLFQIFAWTYYFDILLGSNIGIGKQYLYVISGLHFAHVLGGLPFLILFIVTAHLRMKDPVSVLVYFSDPSKKMRLENLTTYWHFLDGLWIFLVLFFLINSFI